MLIMVSVASGTPQNVAVGPYTLSFDLNTTIYHEIEILGPIYGVTWEGFNRTYYEVVLNNTDYSTLIGFARYDHEMEAGNESMEGSVVEFLRCLGCRDIESYGREIDGQVGFVASGINIFDRPEVFAIYWPDRVSFYPGTYSGTVSCTISSDLPEKVVESLLDTIHVEGAPERTGAEVDYSQQTPEGDCSLYYYCRG